MKKKVTITAVVIICILLVVAVALSANRAGGEIGFEATLLEWYYQRLVCSSC